MVHLLPYERYDLYKEAVNRLTAMADCLLDHSLCKTFLSCYQDCSDPAQGEVDQAEINWLEAECGTPARKSGQVMVGEPVGGQGNVALAPSQNSWKEKSSYPGGTREEEESTTSSGGGFVTLPPGQINRQEETTSSYSEEGGECRTPAKKRNYGQLNDGSKIHLRKDYGVDELDDDGLGNLAQDQNILQLAEENNLVCKKSKAGKSKSTAKLENKREAYRKCPWSKNHKNKATLIKKKTIMNLPVLDKFGTPAAGLQVLTRRSYQDMLQNKKEVVIVKTDKMLLQVIKDISKRLSEEVFSDEGEKVIGKTRTILDLPTLAVKIKTEKSSVKVAAIEFGSWYEAVRSIPVEDLVNVPKDELKSQYKVFLARLEEVTKNYSIIQLKNLDSKVLLKKFFDPANELYNDVELVLHAMAVASVKSSCESVLESHVSQYEVHFNERRNVDEQTANEEFEIATNGPNLAHADSIIIEAMNIHFKQKPWHFFRTTIMEKLVNQNGTSNVLNRLDSVRNNLPIMD